VLATPTPLKPNTYKGKILVLHGVDDPVVPDDQTMAFWKEMRDAKANWEFVAYGNALHTFTNWLMPEDGPPPARPTTSKLIGFPGSPCRISSKRFLGKTTEAGAFGANTSHARNVSKPLLANFQTENVDTSH
jgi:hypothetical protein